MLENDDKKYVLNTYAKNYTNFIKGKNARLFDENNKEYIDFTSGIGVLSLGHANEQITKTICEQASKILHISNLYVIEPQVKLAKKIVELSPFEDGGVFFANSGAEANEGAIKLARKYGEIKKAKSKENKPFKIISLKNSFHGRTIATAKATAQNSIHPLSFAPYPEGFIYVETLEDIYKNIDDKTLGVMIELIQGEGGVLTFPKEEIQKLASYLKEKGVLLIVDEVQTGVFRTGDFLCSQMYGICPDIVTLAKGLGGGVPIGAVLTSHKDIFTAGDHGSTFGGNYLVTATSLEVLKILKDLKDSGVLENKIKYFHQKLENTLKQFPKIFSKIQGLGLMKGLSLKEAEQLKKLIGLCLDEGLLVLKAGKNTLRFLPALSISTEEIDLGFQRLETALKKL